jgi:hypothetical protein
MRQEVRLGSELVGSGGVVSTYLEALASILSQVYLVALPTPAPRLYVHGHPAQTPNPRLSLTL